MRWERSCRCRRRDCRTRVAGGRSDPSTTCRSTSSSSTLDTDTEARSASPPAAITARPEAVRVEGRAAPAAAAAVVGSRSARRRRSRATTTTASAGTTPSTRRRRGRAVVAPAAGLRVGAILQGRREQQQHGLETSRRRLPDHNHRGGGDGLGRGRRRLPQVHVVRRPARSFIPRSKPSFSANPSHRGASLFVFRTDSAHSRACSLPIYF